MELSEKTLQVLKNYANINPNIVIDAGSKLRTISEAKNVFSSSDVSEEFPMRFGIYDLHEFLGVLSLVDVPNLKFSDEYVTIMSSDGRSKVKYFFSEPEMLTTSDRDIKMPPAEVEFDFTNETFNQIKKAASALGHEEMAITGKDGVLTLSVLDQANSTSNTFDLEIPGEFPQGEFRFIFNIANLKMTPGNYRVKLSSKRVSHFVNSETGIQYWIAMETTSINPGNYHG